MSLPESASVGLDPGSPSTHPTPQWTAMSQNPPDDSGGWMFRLKKSFPPLCECFECSQQYRTTKLQENALFRCSATRSEDDAQALLGEEVDSMRADQAYLRETLAKHGNTILGRWKKKSVAKRVEFLKRPFLGWSRTSVPTSNTCTISAFQRTKTSTAMPFCCRT